MLYFHIHRAAQYELKQMLDNLSVKLKAIQKAQETPAHLDEYVRKLINVKHKVTVIYNVLTTSQVIIWNINILKSSLKSHYNLLGTIKSHLSSSGK